jgi:exodeoxyribonuclease V alpha subunit
MNAENHPKVSTWQNKSTSNVVHVRQVVQIKKCRDRGYATVYLINNDGAVIPRDKTLVVKFPSSTGSLASLGSLWKISGKEYINQYSVHGTSITEYTIEAEEVKYLRPSGRILARWISANINGIGSVIANRLVRTRNLSDLIESRDTDALLEISGMSNERIRRLYEKWPDESLYKTIEWLQEQQLPIGLSDKLVAIFGATAIDQIKSHPFLLMAMGLPFEITMRVARNLDIPMSDNCIVAGVALHVALKNAEATGSTVIGNNDLLYGCSSLMNTDVPVDVGDVAVGEGLLVKTKDGYQVYGKALMEAAVAQFLVNAHRRQPGADVLPAAWEAGITRDVVETALSDYESSLSFSLTDEQRAAVIGSVMAPVCCISGGAGTGKTTILKAILGVYEAIAHGSLPCYQVALSGRAARRMAESTDRPAQTIAKLIAMHIGEHKPDLPSHLLLVIDEASMVDLLSMYKLIGMLPRATRIMFVGDTSQLPPVGDGLVFHALTDTMLPFFNLSQVKRQGELSGIHKFATAVRQSVLMYPRRTMQTLAASGDCSIETNASIPRLIDLWREAGGVGNIVLSPLRDSEFGVEHINKKLQESEGLDRSGLYYQDKQRGWIPWITSAGDMLLEGDPVLVTVNNYDDKADIRNGDLGLITEVFSRPDENDGAVGVVEINGVAVYLTPNLLEKIQLGYAITIHKSQGSEWPTCFVMLPIEASGMIDQTLVYTAITRPADRLILMGDERVIDQAIARGSIALERKTCLRERVMLAEMSA